MGLHTIIPQLQGAGSGLLSPSAHRRSATKAFCVILARRPERVALAETADGHNECARRLLRLILHANMWEMNKVNKIRWTLLRLAGRDYAEVKGDGPRRDQHSA